MSNKDLEIKSILDKVLAKEITNNKAWELLWLWKRQIIRKKNKYRLEWALWILHKARWKPSNNKKDDSKYLKILRLRKEKYNDYNIIHFREKLLEKHKIKISYWTLRNELIKNWLVQYKKRKIQKQFTKRERVANYGELVQYDGSYHKWLEERNWGEELCLLVKVDDATGEINAKFDKSEWLIPTMKFWKGEFEKNWKPRIIYLDKFATYKINHKNATNDKELPTQFWRMCQTLWVKLIFANSPEWKWRVERMNLTLQDRLIKEMREENICDMDSANKFLKETFLPKFNKKFSIEPREKANLHIILTKDENEHLNQIFSKHSERKLKNDFTISFKNQYLQCYRNKKWWWPILYKGDKIIVEEHLNWKIYLSKNWKYLTFKKLEEKRKRQYKLPMAPVSISHFEEMTKEIEKLEEISKIQKENEIELLKTNILSHYEKTWKKHPWMTNFQIWKNANKKVTF